ncbi:MAG: SRPBCC family protein [Prevotellaceae bacterium]|jgi:hypothetical protein|nr:SRPBCC family protein [Prevotellaceae bacterium]
MNTYESEIKRIIRSQHELFHYLSDLRNMAVLNEHVFQEQASNTEHDEDSFTFTHDSIGTVTLHVVEREPDKRIRFTAKIQFVTLDMLIELTAASDSETDMKMTLSFSGNIPHIFKMMIEGKLQNIVNQIADTLAHSLNQKQRI